MNRRIPARLATVIPLLALFLLGASTPQSPVQAQPAFDCTTVTEIPTTECEALTALYNSTNGVNWYNNDGWLATTTPCSWYGLYCSEGHVVELYLGSNQLSGAIPPEIGNLTALQTLRLSWNQLGGAIPPGIGNLIALYELDLRGNQLTDAVPHELGNLVNLRYLALPSNQLNGSIPHELGNLVNLEYLNLSSNQLSGSIPPELGNLANLGNLNLYSNQLSGSIPSELGNLASLRWLDIGSNQLSGIIPPELGNFATMDGYLSLASNQLSGSIPPELGNLANVGGISLNSNQLSGSIPSELGNLVGLRSLYLDSNQLSGNIPPEIGNLTNLLYLSLNFNQLSGSIPPEIGNLANLQSLHLNSNQLSGSIPSELGDLTSLQYLYLRSNQLNGNIPPELGNLINLRWLDLAYNRLNGNIPPELGNLINLQSLSLNSNQLSGSIPPELGNLVSLWSLYLNSNQLSGNIPPELGDLVNLQYLLLNSNQLSGNIPPELDNLANLRYLYLYSNQLSGSIPPELGNLVSLWSLYLNSNQLSGNIPPELDNLVNLQYLVLNSNQLIGNIPLELDNLTNLRYLYLYSNQLSGSIPPELGNLAALRHLLLNGNPLSGEIPNALTPLALEFFTFYDTDLCAPATSGMTSWLNGIPNLYGTGLICGQAPGSLGGSVTLTDTTPIANAQVNLYRSLQWGQWQPVSTTLTSATGTYVLSGLGQGPGIDYRVQFVDPSQQLAPQYYDNMPTIAAATVVTITPGVPRTGIDAVLALPQPPAVGVDAGSGSVVFNPDGTAQINIPAPNPSDIIITRAVSCAQGAPEEVTLLLSTGREYPMIGLGGDLYEATIPTADLTGNATISVVVTCNGSTTTTTVGYITLYDPSGFITDARTGQPIAGASVTLYHVPGWQPKTGPEDNRPNTCESNLSRPPGAPWSQPAPTDLGMIANADVTPIAPRLPFQLTTTDGYYGWDVSLGCWYVRVEASGYQSLVSPVVGVPPEVTDLNLMLIPAICPDFNGSSRVDVHDVMQAAARWNDPTAYNPTYDVAPPFGSPIDIQDIIAIAEQWDVTCQ